MEIVKGMPKVKQGAAVITNGVLHGLALMFATGLLLVAMRYMLDEPVNNAKIGVKTLVLIAMVVVVLLNRKKRSVSAAVLGSIAGLGVLNVALAVLWR
jgi:hypothetical protein